MRARVQREFARKVAPFWLSAGHGARFKAPASAATFPELLCVV